MIRIDALRTSDGHIHSVRITATAEDAAKLPKSVRINPRYNGAHINFKSDGANHGANETGARRVRSLLKNADKHGIGVVFDQSAYVLNALNASVRSGGPGSLTQMVRSDVEAAVNAILS